jgi:uncharacterized membrane protein HdeD (DUF308 family)
MVFWRHLPIDTNMGGGAMNEAEASGVGSITKSATWIGVGLIIIGVLALAVPQQSGMAIAVGVGILLLLSGLLRVVFLFLSPSWGAFLLRLLFGGLSVVAGAMMILDPAFGLKAITIVAIVYFIFDGITEIILGLQLPPGTGGIWMMLSGAVSLVLGIFIWRQWPMSGDVAVAILVGIKLILNGIVIIALARGAKALGDMVRDASSAD